jgi:two-component system response regulator HydG/two-component system response regulator AtoC
MVSQGRFREDLYYRLNVIRLRVPPLRERRSEIPTIVNYYVNHYSAKFGRKDIQITPQAVDLLMVSDWPGNVRQLCNEIQRTVARSEDGTITYYAFGSVDCVDTVVNNPAKDRHPCRCACGS